MDFLASPEALELEDQIEEVNAKHLEKLVKERPFVAVFFCKLFFECLCLKNFRWQLFFVVQVATQAFLFLGYKTRPYISHNKWVQYFPDCYGPGLNSI